MIHRKSSNHRRAVAACLVQSVYILERDRQENRQGHDALAPPWWEFLHFEPVHVLVDDVDSSIFGAIFEFMPPASAQNSTAVIAPKYVVAYRGTITKKDSVNRDLSLDLHLVRNGLHQTSRSKIAIQAVQNVISVAAGSSNIWLSGHSLGAAIATVAGKNAAKSGVLLETYLFNPPFVSAPIEKIKDEEVKHSIRIVGSLITAGLSVALRGLGARPNLEEDPFSVLSSWFPDIFVHPDDPICSEYIGYFQHRKRMDEMGAGVIEKLATQNSIGGLLWSAIGKESDPLHLLPSASLTVNMSPCDFKKAHALHQWWKLDLHLHTRQYRYE